MVSWMEEMPYAEVTVAFPLLSVVSHSVLQVYLEYYKTLTVVSHPTIINTWHTNGTVIRLGLKTTSSSSPSIVKVHIIEVSDSFSVSDSIGSKVLILSPTEGIILTDPIQLRALSVFSTSPVDIVATIQAIDVQLVVLTQDNDLAPSINPSSITLFATDTGPQLRFQVVEDVTGQPVDLTGATIDFFVQRIGQTTPVWEPPLTSCEPMPNPATVSTAVVGSSSPQSIHISDSSQFSTSSPTNLVDIGFGLTDEEVVLITTIADGTHITGIFLNNHAVGEYIQVDSILNHSAILGWCTFAWPVGGLKTYSTYTGQMRVVLPDSAHTTFRTVPITITVLPKIS